MAIRGQREKKERNGNEGLEREGKVVFFLWFASYFAREAGHFFVRKGGHLASLWYEEGREI